jgi:hypothetical protein
VCDEDIARGEERMLESHGCVGMQVEGDGPHNLIIRFSNPTRNQNITALRDTLLLRDGRSVKVRVNRAMHLQTTQRRVFEREARTSASSWLTCLFFSISDLLPQMQRQMSCPIIFRSSFTQSLTCAHPTDRCREHGREREKGGWGGVSHRE